MAAFMEETLASASTSVENRSERRRPPPPKAAPWLVFPYGKGGKAQQAFYNLCEPENRTCRKLIPEMSRKSYWQKPCHQGWMVMLCDDDKAEYPNCQYGDCFLWNPLSLETIQLPNLSLNWLANKSKHHYKIRDCVLSSSPPKNNNLDGCDDNNSMVFFLMEQLVGDVRDQVLVYCRATGEDKQWRTKELSGYIVDEEGDPNHVLSLLSFKGKLYGLCLNSDHLEIEIQLGHEDDETINIKSFKVSGIGNMFFELVGGACSQIDKHFIETSDELFYIDISYNPRGYKDIVTAIRILRLDFSLMAWEKVKTLGDHVLFLGKNTKACCSAAELGLTRGCLYYTMCDDQSLYKFELEDKAFTPILPCLKLPKPWSSADWMMMPTFVRVADGRREIEDILGHDEKDNILEAEEKKTCLSNGEKEKQGQKYSGGELGEARPWGILNEDMVELIASYLHLVDYLHFRAVCKVTRSIIPAVKRKSSSTGIIKTTHLSPWLVFSRNNDTIYSFVNPMLDNEIYLMNLSDLLVGATICCSKGGWLLMSKGKKTLFFYNPFTRATIQLPDLPERYCFTGMSFSSLPTSSDCVVFGIAHEDLYEISIYVIKRGTDSWRFRIFENFDLERYMPCINNPVFYDGSIYCLDYSGALGVFNLEDGLSWKVLANPRGHFNAVYPSFLVECDGTLILVDLGYLGKSVGIFRLDFAKMVWDKVESLGNHMLFISNTSSISAVAPDSRMENKIYFPRLHGERILFYSLDTGRYHCLGSQHSAMDFYDTTEWSNCTWIEPNWLETTEQELDWLSI